MKTQFSLSFTFVLKVAPVKDTVPRDLPAVSHPKLPSKCGQILVENNAPRIIDGHEAKPGLYPWQVLHKIKVSNILFYIMRNTCR